MTDDAIDTLVSFLDAAPSPRAMVIIDQFGGAVARVGQDATAFGHRDAAYDLVIAAVWSEPGEQDANVAWACSFWDAMRPHSTEDVVKYLSDEGDEPGPRRLWPPLPAFAAQWSTIHSWAAARSVVIGISATRSGRRRASSFSSPRRRLLYGRARRSTPLRANRSITTKQAGRATASRSARLALGGAAVRARRSRGVGHSTRRVRRRAPRRWRAR